MRKRIITNSFNALFNSISSGPSRDVVVGLKSLFECVPVTLIVLHVLLNLRGISPSVDLGLDVVVVNEVFDVVIKGLEVVGNVLLVGVVDVDGGHLRTRASEA